MASGFIDALARIVGPRHVLTSPATLVSYAIDATVGYRGEPTAAVFPGTAGEAAALLKLASERGQTVVARGAGTSLAAGAVPSKGSLVLSLSRLRDGPRVNSSDLTVSAGAGLTTGEVQEAARGFGYFYPPDPSSEDVATMGGNAATNAGGPHALKYGVTRHYVTALEVALCAGEVVRVQRGKATEPLVDLFIGSEGTLGLITAVEARLIAAPQGTSTLMAAFRNAANAAQATVDLLATGLVPAKLEFMDAVCIRAVQAARDRGLRLDIGALLLIELHGDAEVLESDGKLALESLLRSGASEARRPSTADEAALLWEARGAITSSLARLQPGKIGEDICVPRTRLPYAVEAIEEVSRSREVTIALFGHIGDGTLHPNIVYDPSDESDRRAARESLGEIARIGVAAGGVLSGEHGLGLVKRDFVPLAWDWETIRAMRRLKRELDPTGVLNPDIMWPEEPPGSPL